MPLYVSQLYKSVLDMDMDHLGHPSKDKYVSRSAGFTLQTVDVDTVSIWYPSAWHVMRDTRALGDANAAYNRPLRLNKDVQFAAAAIYDEMHGKVRNFHPRAQSLSPQSTVSYSPEHSIFLTRAQYLSHQSTVSFTPEQSLFLLTAQYISP